jgi:hypothetical protein
VWPGSNDVFRSQNADLLGHPSNIGRRTPAAGNGIFGCRDGRPKSGLESASFTRDRRSETIPGKNPRRNGLFLCGPKNYGLAGLDGGRDRDRTCDPLDVNEVLSR